MSTEGDMNPASLPSSNHPPLDLPQDAAATPPAPGLTRPPLDPERILDATDRCFAAVGYDGTTIRRIAAELGCAVGSIYRHFEDKRALLFSLTQRRFRGVLQAAQAGEPLANSLRQYRNIAASDPVSYRLMFWLASVSEGAGLVPPIIDELLGAWSRQAGGLPAARALWARIHGELALGLSAEAATPIPAVASASRLAELWESPGAAAPTPMASTGRGTSTQVTPTQAAQDIAGLVGEIMEQKPARLAEPDDVCLL